MKRVFFATNFKDAAAPTSNGEMSVFIPSTGAYLDYGQATAASTYDELVIQVMRDSKILNFSHYPKNGTASKATFTAAAKNKVTFTPTSGLSVTAGKSFTLAIGLAGKGVDFNRYTKKITVEGGTTVNKTLVSNVETLLDAFHYHLGAGASYTGIPGVKFKATQVSTTALYVEMDAGYEHESFIMWVEGDLTGAIVNTTPIAGMSATEIKKLESDADTELGDRKFNYRASDFFDLESGYNADCTDLAVFKSSKPDMYPLPREGNFEQELLLFYDADKDTGADSEGAAAILFSAIVDWLVGTASTIVAEV